MYKDQGSGAVGVTPRSRRSRAASGAGAACRRALYQQRQRSQHSRQSPRQRQAGRLRGHSGGPSGRGRYRQADRGGQGRTGAPRRAAAVSPDSRRGAGGLLKRHRPAKKLPSQSGAGRCRGGTPQLAGFARQSNWVYINQDKTGVTLEMLSVWVVELSASPGG